MMKAYFPSICICSLGVFLYSSSALSFSHSTNLVAQIKPNLTKGSEPASLTKLAGIYFISRDDNHKFGSGGHDIKNDPKSCPSGTTWYEGSCRKNCDRTLYPFDSKPDSKKGTSHYILCMGYLLFGYESCNDGWLLNGGNCDVNPCTGFNFTSVPDSSKGTVAKCKSGDNWKYKYTDCNDGWDFSNGNCNTHICDTNAFPYPNDPGSEAGTVTHCKTGTNYRYGYLKCNTGWAKSGGYCYPNTCTGFNSTSASMTGCKKTEVCQKGSQTVYKCVTPQDGYHIDNDGTVKPNACDGYTSTSSVIANCISTEPCKKGASTVYKCTVCNGSWDAKKGVCDGCTTRHYTYIEGESVCLLGVPVIYSGNTAIGVAVSEGLNTKEGMVVAMTDEKGGAKMTWADAVAACKAKTTGGKNWRLPTQEESGKGVLGYDSTFMYYAKEDLDITLTTNGGTGLIDSGMHWCSTDNGSGNKYQFSIHSTSAWFGSDKPTDKAKVRCVYHR